MQRVGGGNEARAPVGKCLLTRSLKGGVVSRHVLRLLVIPPLFCSPGVHILQRRKLSRFLRLSHDLLPLLAFFITRPPPEEAIASTRARTRTVFLSTMKGGFDTRRNVIKAKATRTVFQPPAFLSRLTLLLLFL
jgi:hypothetical protein